VDPPEVRSLKYQQENGRDEKPPHR